MGKQSLLQALQKAELGKLEDLSHLIDSQPDLSTAQTSDGTTLLLAVLAPPTPTNLPELQKIVKKLLNTGANLEANNPSKGWTSPLHLATQNGYLEIMEDLLNAGCLVDSFGNHTHGMTAMECALFEGKTKAAKILAARGAKADLRLAGGLGWIDVVKKAEGDDPIKSGHNGAFLYACINGQTEVVEYLIKWGVDVNLQPPGLDFGGISATGLHRAAQHGQKETCQALIRLGARRDITDDIYEKTPAEWATFFGHHKLAMEIAP